MSESATEEKTRTIETPEGSFTIRLTMDDMGSVYPGMIRYNIEVVDARNNNIVAMSSRTVPIDPNVAVLSRGEGPTFNAPTVSTTDPREFEREQEALMSRHW